MNITAKNLAQYASSLNLSPASKKKEDIEAALEAHDANWETSILSFIEEEEKKSKGGNTPETLTHADHVAALANNTDFQKALAAMGGSTGWVSPDELENDTDHFLVVAFDGITGLPVMRTKSVVVKGKKRTTVQSTTANAYYEDFKFVGDNTHINVKALCDALGAGMLEAIESTALKNIKGENAFSDYVEFSSKEARPVLLYRATIQVTGTASTGAAGDYGKQVRFVSAFVSAS